MLTAWLRKKKAATLGLVAMVALGARLAAEAWPVPANDAADAAMEAIRPEGIRAGMRFLADDLLEGRGTATRGVRGSQATRELLPRSRSRFQYRR